MVVIAVLVVLGVVLIGLWRFLTVRSVGTQVILREMPATGPHGWRHGRVRYAGETAQYYKLRSLSPWADAVVDRRELSLDGRRDVTPDEASFIPADRTVVQFHHTDGRRWEMVLDRTAEMAFTAWLEAAPDRRQERIDLSALLRQISRERPAS